MDSHVDQRREIEHELQRVYGGAAHFNVVGDPTKPWSGADAARVLSILRSLPDGAGEAAVVRAFGIALQEIWQGGVLVEERSLHPGSDRDRD